MATEKEQTPQTRTFDLGTVLTITTDRVLTDDFSNVYKILSFLTQEDLWTTQIPRAADAAKSYILQKYPQLAGVGEKEKITTKEELAKFLAEKAEIFGNEFTFEPMTKLLYEHMDPITEFHSKYPDKPILVAVIKGDEQDEQQEK